LTSGAAASPTDQARTALLLALLAGLVLALGVLAALAIAVAR
jgi:hypothetical protein